MITAADVDRLLGLEVRLLWDDCCAQGSIVGVLRDFKADEYEGKPLDQDEWAAEHTYTIDGVEITATSIRIMCPFSDKSFCRLEINHEGDHVGADR